MRSSAEGLDTAAALRWSGSVTMLNPSFWPEVRRGSERVIADLGRGVTAAGGHARLITSHPKRRSVSSELGMEVVRARRLPEGLLARRGLHERHGHALSSWVELRRASGEKSALLHAFYPVDAAVAIGPAKRLGGLIFSVMGIAEPDRIAARRARRMLWARALRSEAVVALSEAAAIPLRAMGVDPRVIPPGVDTDAFRRTAARSAVPTVLCPADPDDRRKRVPLLIEACGALRERIPELRLQLGVRPGSARPTLPEWVELANLDGAEPLTTAYSEAWVTALPSRREAFGLVLGESLACGTPVVASDEGGIPEVLGGAEGVGRLWRSGGAEGLAAALEEGLELARSSTVEERCRAVAQGLSVQRMVDAYLELYRELEHGG